MTIKNINNLDITTPTELFQYFCQTMEYGWIGNDGNRYIQTMVPLRKTYRTQSVDSAFHSHLITCIEQTSIVYDYCQKWGYPVKQFCFRKYEEKEAMDEKVLMHCFPIYQKENHWYHFDYTNDQFRGIHRYDTLEEAIETITSKYPKDDIRVLTEIPGKIPVGLSYYQWNLYVNQFPEYLYKVHETKSR